MEYEWDETKRLENLAKHGIDFNAIRGFDWDHALIEPSPRTGEMRFVSIGHIDQELHVVIYTMRRGLKRIISLRPPSSRERSRYDKA